MRSYSTRRQALRSTGLLLALIFLRPPRARADQTPPRRRLLVTVRQESGPPQTGGPKTGERVYSSREGGDRQETQQVQVVEGARAYVQLEQRVPVVTSRAVGGGVRGGFVGDEVQYQEVHTGFSVAPTLAGDEVLLDIRFAAAPPVSATGTPAVSAGGVPTGEAANPSLTTGEIVTTVRGRLGEWIDVGGATRTVRGGSGRVLSSGDASGDSRRVWVKVEEVR